MTQKNILKRKVDFQYETIVDIYNAGGCESVREYIDNNDIDEEDYTDVLDKIVINSSAADDELFALMIATKKFDYTTYIECRDSTECPKFIDCIENIEHKKCPKYMGCIERIEDKECTEDMLCIEIIGDDKCTECPPQYVNYAVSLSRYIHYSGVNLFKLDLLWNIEELKHYTHSPECLDCILEYENTNALIKVLEYNPTTLKSINYMEEEKRANFMKLVDNFTKKSIYSTTSITEENFKKLLDIISKNVSEDEFQFLLEYLITNLVDIYGVVESLDIFELQLGKRTYNNHYNIIELAKYIHNLYGHKFKIRFNIDYNRNYHVWRYQKENMMYDQMIFNGYEFLSTFASIFYEDLFFPKKDLINHISDRNNLLKRKIKEGDVNKKDMLPYIGYKKTLSELVSNIHTITKKIDSEQLKCLKDLIADIDIIYDEMMDKYIHRLI